MNWFATLTVEDLTELERELSTVEITLIMCHLHFTDTVTC